VSGLRRGVVIVALLVLAIPASGGIASVEAAGAVVRMTEWSFSPSPVTIKAGQSVTWINDGHVTHYLSIGTTLSGGPWIIAGPIPPGGRYTRTYRQVGAFAYRDGLNTSITGSVVVQAAPKATPTPKATPRPTPRPTARPTAKPTAKPTSSPKASLAPTASASSSTTAVVEPGSSASSGAGAAASSEGISPSPDTQPAPASATQSGTDWSLPVIGILVVALLLVLGWAYRMSRRNRRVVGGAWTGAQKGDELDDWDQRPK
jgi:plastocyanin